VSLRTALTSVVLLPAALSGQAQDVPHPRDILGFTPGDDYRIADFTQMQTYFEALAVAAPRVHLSSAGKSTEGRDILVAVITSEANLQHVNRYKEISQSLARGRGLTDSEAHALAREGKAIVWIDNGLHAAETAHAQHAFLLAHKVATEESEQMRRIRDNVVLVLLPSVNPDGLDLVADWYRKTARTPHQDSPMPWLFNTYSGYENNRDGYAQTQIETQVMSRLLYFEWLPQVMYNHHQGFYPSRIFVPPFPDPFNPNIDPGVIRGIEMVGTAMQYRYEQEGKEGVLSRYGFSSWYNGSLRTTTYFHNMIGILTETTHDSPSPFYYDPDSMPATFGNGWSTRTPSTNYTRPWRGGTLRFADALDYMLTGSMAVLDVASKNPEEFLYGMYRMASRQIDLGTTESPRAFVIPAKQHDATAVAKFIETLMRGGVEVHRAAAAFVTDGRTYPAGSFVVQLAQAFRPFAKDLLEPQRYPDIRRYPGGPPVPPYDNAGWTLSYQMGVEAVPTDAAIAVDLELLDAFPRAQGHVSATGTYGYAIDARINNAFKAVMRLLADGREVQRATEPLSVSPTTQLPAGTFIVSSTGVSPDAMQILADQLGIAAFGLEAQPDVPLETVRLPRIAVYRSWVVEWVDGWTASEGWTRFVLDNHDFPYENIYNADVRAGHLRSRFDVVVIPNQSSDDIVNGYREGRRQFGVAHQNLVPPEYQGGIGEDGLRALRGFAEAGGTLVLVDRATDMAWESLNMPVREVLHGLPDTQFFGPGSVVRIESDPAHPIAYGMPETGAAYFRKSRAFAFSDESVSSIARYAESDVLLSGWLLGEEHMAGQHAAVEIDVGAGKAILLGFSPYFRSQPLGTFKLFFNALLRMQGSLAP